MTTSQEILRAKLDGTLATTDFPAVGEKYEGKVRDCYVDAAKGLRTIIVTDRLSAFDQIVGTIPFKGQVLNQIAQHWFDVTADIAPNHVVSVPDPNVMVGQECMPLLAEFVMRGYLTGVTSTSVWRAYERGDRSFCGHALADGMRKNEPLPEPILTPSTKAEKGDHDVSVSKDQLLAMGAVTPEHFERAEAIAKALFARGQKLAAERGLILVDTKYEMGLSDEGELLVIDEIHTPDSSRYWFAEDYEARFAHGEEPRSLDKELVRRHLVDEHGYRGDGPPPPLSDAIRVAAAERYIEIYELCTGRAFVPDPAADVAARIAAHLEVAL